MTPEGPDKKGASSSARFWLDKARELELRPRRGAGYQKELQEVRSAAIKCMITDGASRDVVDLISHLLGGNFGPVLERDRVVWQRRCAQLAAAAYEAAHEAASVSDIARAYASVMGSNADSYRKQAAELRRDPAYQKKVAAIRAIELRRRDGH
jgi:hypothetical protein